jgi:amino acid transporter
MYSTLKRILLGPPIASSEEGHQRLSKKVALPVFSSDAISSTAYATEEILIVLLVIASVGSVAFDFLVPISLAVIVLLAIVVASYFQTIHAYPMGGGSYVVSRENLGTYPSLVAGGSLLVDYILTVAVSTTAGVAAIISAFNGLEPYRVPMCLLAIGIVTLANLRGLRESGSLFAPPTYIYVLSLFLMIGVGLYKVFFQDLGPIAHTGEEQELLEMSGAVTFFFLAKAFSSGAVALTGVEAVCDGVPAFKKPEPRNASTTIVIMATILGSAFLGLSILASHLEPVKTEATPQTVLAQMAEHVYGGRGIPFFIMQFATFAILLLAANTAYADYPRLSSIIAKDGFIPRQFRNRGDRLVFSNGVIFLALAAMALVVVFGGEVTALIPLYAIGVFTSFTLSQTGMVRHHFRHRAPRWPFLATINGVGAMTTAFVASMVIITKFTDGAWIPVVLIPLQVIGFKLVKRHYDKVGRAVRVEPGYRPKRRTHTVVVLVGGVNRGVLEAVTYARSLAPDRLLALSVVAEPEEQQEVQHAWADFKVPVELQTIYTPYRELTRPILAFLDELDANNPDDWITVVIPEFVTSWQSQFLHNQSALALKARLLYRPNTVVTSVPVVVDVHADGGTAPGTAAPSTSLLD